MRCRESNVFKRKGENDKTESKDEGNKLYRHAEKGVKSSCLRSICRKLPDYIGTVDGLELFLAMVKVEWGRGRHSKNDYVTRENGELILINYVASKNVDAFVERVRNACIEETKEGKILRTENLISSLQDLMNDICRTHPLRSATLFHEFLIHSLISFCHFLHISDRKQKKDMRKRLTQVV